MHTPINERTKHTIEHRPPEHFEWTLDDLGFARWTDDVREEVMRIVIAVESGMIGRPYTAADAVREIQSGEFGEVVFSALRDAGALNLVGIGEGVGWPVTVEKIRKRIVEQTGESMRAVIRRTTGFSHEQLAMLIAPPPIPPITDDLRAEHDAAIFVAKVKFRAHQLWLDADFAGDLRDYFDAAYAQIADMKPALVA